MACLATIGINSSFIVVGSCVTPANFKAFYLTTISITQLDEIMKIATLGLTMVQLTMIGYVNLASTSQTTAIILILFCGAIAIHVFVGANIFAITAMHGGMMSEDPVVDPRLLQTQHPSCKSAALRAVINFIENCPTMDDCKNFYSK